MGGTSTTKTVVLFLLLIIVVAGLSFVSNRLWGGKPEKLPEPREWTIHTDQTTENGIL